MSLAFVSLFCLFSPSSSDNHSVFYCPSLSHSLIAIYISLFPARPSISLHLSLSLPSMHCTFRNKLSLPPPESMHFISIDLLRTSRCSLVHILVTIRLFSITWSELELNSTSITLHPLVSFHIALLGQNCSKFASSKWAPLNALLALLFTTI